ncbi:MAG: alpha/beta hydrolase [Patescibacteria group bacterium]|jgi:alpha/beta superfamily hydrolase
MRNRWIGLYSVGVVVVVIGGVLGFVWWKNGFDEYMPVSGNVVNVTLVPEETVNLPARYYASAGVVGRRGVILLHQNNSNQNSWNRLAAELQERDFEVMTFDFRTTTDYNLLVNDAAEAVKYLRDIKADMPIAVVGAGLGANVAMRLVDQDTALTAVALISPQYNYSGVKITRANQRFVRPVYYLVSQSDAVSLAATQGLYDKSRSITKTLRIVTEASGRGTKLLRHAPKLRAGLIDWLTTVL